MFPPVLGIYRDFAKRKVNISAVLWPLRGRGYKWPVHSTWIVHSIVGFSQRPATYHSSTLVSLQLSRLMTKPTKWVGAQRRLRSVWASAQSEVCLVIRQVWSESLLCAQWVAQHPSNFKRTAKTLIRLGGVFAGRRTNSTKWHVRLAKTQISLGIRPVWDQPGHPPSLIRVFAVRSVGSSAPKLFHADSEDSEQTGRSLRWAHSRFVDFVMSRLT